MENKDDPSKKGEDKPDSQMQNEQISSSLVDDEDMEDEKKSNMLDADAVMETNSEANKEVAQIEIKKKDEHKEAIQVESAEAINKQKLKQLEEAKKKK